MYGFSVYYVVRNQMNGESGGCSGQGGGGQVGGEERGVMGGYSGWIYKGGQISHIVTDLRVLSTAVDLSDSNRHFYFS